jgi:hypothetical protein
MVARDFAHAVRLHRLTAWAKSREASVPFHQLWQATLLTLRRLRVIKSVATARSHNPEPGMKHRMF